MHAYLKESMLLRQIKDDRILSFQLLTDTNTYYTKTFRVCRKGANFDVLLGKYWEQEELSAVARQPSPTAIFESPLKRSLENLVIK